MEKRILLVDDDRQLCRTVAKILGQLGLEVIEAYDAVSGIQKLRSEHFDLLISDGNMPKFDGFQMVKLLRSKHPHMPVVMLTGLKEREDIEQAIHLGVQGYIVKPFAAETLIAKISDILEKSARHQASPKSAEARPTASLSLIFPLVSVSLTHVRVVLPFFLRSGEVLPLRISWLEDQGLTDLQYKVESAQLLVNGEGYATQLHLQNLNPIQRMVLEEIVGPSGEIWLNEKIFR